MKTTRISNPALLPLGVLGWLTAVWPMAYTKAGRRWRGKR